MAAVWVQGNKNSGGSGSSGTITLTGTTAGNFIAICVGGSPGGGIANNSVSSVTGDSNTWLKPAGLLTTYALASDGFAQIVYAFNSTGGSLSLTVNFTNACFWALLIGEWSGVQTSSDPLDLHNTDFGDSTSPATNSISPASAELVIATFNEGDISTTWTSPGGWNVREETQSDGNNDASMIDKLGASGSQSATWTGLSSAAHWGGVIGSFKLTAASTAPIGNEVIIMQSVRNAVYF